MRVWQLPWNMKKGKKEQRNILSLDTLHKKTKPNLWENEFDSNCQGASLSSWYLCVCVCLHVFEGSCVKAYLLVFKLQFIYLHSKPPWFPSIYFGLASDMKSKEPVKPSRDVLKNLSLQMVCEFLNTKNVDYSVGLQKNS